MEISALVKRQRAFFFQGETLDYSFRLKALKRLSAAINELEEEIKTALKVDLNKSEIESFMTEIGIVQSETKLVIKNLKSWMKKQKVKTAGLLFPAKCYIIPEPYGVALIMSPWNYPFLLTMVPLISAIAAGNCVVIKPSAYSPETAKIIVKIISSCFKTDFCAVVTGSRQENTELLKQKFDYIFFTGSTEVGKVVMSSAAQHLTPVTLELGGKSPVIVDETANIDLAAKRLVFGKFINAGQTCVAPDYIMVHHSQKEELLKKLKYHINKQYPKNTKGEIIDYPRIVNEKHFQRLKNLMKGQNVAVRGKSDLEKLIIEPTILTDVPLDSPIMKEEIFGPLLPIIEYQDIKTVIKEIRSRPKPLALYVFSSQEKSWQKIIKTVAFGGGCINDCLLHVASTYLPFGGVGESGMGRYHGKAGFDTFSHYKSIVNKSMKIDIDMRYRPYNKTKIKLIRGLLSLW